MFLPVAPITFFGGGARFFFEDHPPPPAQSIATPPPHTKKSYVRKIFETGRYELFLQKEYFNIIT